MGEGMPTTSASPGMRWERVRITMDSGSTVNVMPKELLAAVEVRPAGSKGGGGKMVAANGTLIKE